MEVVRYTDETIPATFMSNFAIDALGAFDKG
jgi:hypothetical protein